MNLTLKNFQIHKKLSLELKDGFNCLTGGNNRGKSSIVRSLYWLLTNSPAGDWMCRRDANGKKLTATVKLVLDDGTVVKRVKGGGRNYYALDDQEYNDIGRNMPAEIAAALGMGNAAIKALGLNLNIEMQEDMPFLVHESPTVKSGALNILTGVDIIEKTIKEFNRDRLAETREIGHLESEIEIQVDALGKYDVLNEIDFGGCDRITNKIAAFNVKIAECQKLKASRAEKLEIVNRYQYLKDVAKDFMEIEQLLVDISAGRKDLESLSSMAVRVGSCSKFAMPMPFDFGKLGGALDGIAVKNADLVCLRTLQERLRSARKAIAVNRGIMREAGSRLKGMVCPTCGNKMKGVGDGQVCLHN